MFTLDVIINQGIWGCRAAWGKAKHSPLSFGQDKVVRWLKCFYQFEGRETETSLEWVERHSQPPSRPTSLHPAVGKPLYPLGPEKRQWYAVKTVVRMIIKVFFSSGITTVVHSNMQHTLGERICWELASLFSNLSLKWRLRIDQHWLASFLYSTFFLMERDRKCMFGQTTEKNNNFTSP